MLHLLHDPQARFLGIWPGEILSSRYAGTVLDVMNSQPHLARLIAAIILVKQNKAPKWQVWFCRVLKSAHEHSAVGVLTQRID